MFKVPIRNLFYLLSYAHEMPEMVESLNDVDDELITYDFLVEQFNKEVRFIINRGLTKNYVLATEETSHLGGRLLIHESLPSIMWNRPSVVCEKDEFTENILFNQIIKATLEKIYQHQLVTRTKRRESYLLWEELPNIIPINLTREIFFRMYYNRHNLHYKHVIHLAHLLFELTLLSHQHGEWTLFSANISEAELNRLFERFLFNFYQMEQDEYRVHREHMRWDLDGNDAFLPRMETDVSLTHKELSKKIIIDAKFYKNMFQMNHNKASFHSQNMYQMFTYINHQQENLSVRGILIYPYNGYEVKEVYRYNDRLMFEVATVNLEKSWQEIENELLMII